MGIVAFLFSLLALKRCLDLERNALYILSFNLETTVFKISFSCDDYLI